MKYNIFTYLVGEGFKNVLKNNGIPETSFDKIFSIPLLYPNSKEKILIRSAEQTGIALGFMILQAKDKFCIFVS